MKYLGVYTALYALTYGVLLLFPYLTYDVVILEYESLFSHYGPKEKVIQEDIVLYGYEVWLSFVPLLVTLFITPFIHFKRSRSLSAFGGTMGVLNLLYLGLIWMAFSVSPSLYHNYHHIEVQWSFKLQVFLSFVYMLILVLNAAVIKRWPKDDALRSSEVLDDL